MNSYSQVSVSGFTIIRNALKYDFPFKEAVASILPLVDEMVVLMGDSEDDTESDFKKWIDENQDLGTKKIRIEHSTWDMSLKGGQVLSVQTNIALNHCRAKNWCIYIQADECIHEQDIDLISKKMNQFKDDQEVQSLALSYHHFYGDYYTLNRDRGAYRFEVRILKPLKNLKSFGDAQGFRFENGKKPKAVRIPAKVFHYGYIRPIEVMKNKAKDFDKIFHEGNSKEIRNRETHWNQFNYQYKPGLTEFKGTHPKVMETRVTNHLDRIDLALLKRGISIPQKLKDFKITIENALPFRIGEFKNYKPIKRKG